MHYGPWKMSGNTPRSSRKAFTLIELLVVVAIIALLVSILVPSLSRAKEMARMTVCMAHMRGAGNAVHEYAADQNDMLAGPNTSGWDLTNSNIGDFSGDDVTDPTDPVQNMDWASPTLGDALGLPEVRKERIAAILNTDLRCPTNTLRYHYEYKGDSGVEPQSLFYSSYSASLAFHAVSHQNSRWSYTRAITDEKIKTLVQIPIGYYPTMLRIGVPSEKVYLMEGARFVNDSMRISFNGHARQVQGGNFMLWGPVSPMLNGDPFQFNLDKTFREEYNKFTFRHLDQKMNMAFFDGHVETVSFEQAVKTEYYYPSGSVVQDSGVNLLNDPDAYAGRLP